MQDLSEVAIQGCANSENSIQGRASFPGFYERNRLRVDAGEFGDALLRQSLS